SRRISSWWKIGFPAPIPTAPGAIGCFGGGGPLACRRAAASRLAEKAWMADWRWRIRASQKVCVQIPGGETRALYVRRRTPDATRQPAQMRPVAAHVPKAH